MSAHRQPDAHLLRQTTPACTPGGIPAEENKKLTQLLVPHIDSFNYMIDGGLAEAVDDIIPQEVQVGEGGPIMRFWYEDPQVQINSHFFLQFK